jgi:hypothetical protein
MKHLVATSSVNGDIFLESFQRSLLEYRNTPRQNDKTLAQLLFGQNIRSSVPSFNDLPRPFYSRKPSLDSSCSHQPLQTGDHVWVQDHKPGLWNMSGIIGNANGRNYMIRMENGWIYGRNRHHVRKRRVILVPDGGNDLLISSIIEMVLLKLFLVQI